MAATGKKFNTVDEYLSAFPQTTKSILERMRETIRQAAPRGEEVISYNMPAFKFHGMLVWYAANKEHIGFYPTPSAIKSFKDELTSYKTSKGAIQFPMGKAIPEMLVRRIVKFRVNENLEKEKRKKKR